MPTHLVLYGGQATDHVVPEAATSVHRCPTRNGSHCITTLQNWEHTLQLFLQIEGNVLMIVYFDRKMS